MQTSREKQSRRPVLANEFYQNPYRWWQFIKRFKWRKNKQEVGLLTMWSEDADQ